MEALLKSAYIHVFGFTYKNSGTFTTDLILNHSACLNLNGVIIIMYKDYLAYKNIACNPYISVH